MEKPVWPVPMHVVRNTLSRYNKTLQLAYIRKYFKILKAKTTPKTQQLIIICTKVNIFLKLLD